VQNVPPDVALGTRHNREALSRILDAPPQRLAVVDELLAVAAPDLVRAGLPTAEQAGRVASAHTIEELLADQA